MPKRKRLWRLCLASDPCCLEREGSPGQNGAPAPTPALFPVVPLSGLMARIEAPQGPHPQSGFRFSHTSGLALGPWKKVVNMQGPSSSWCRERPPATQWHLGSLGGRGHSGVGGTQLCPCGGGAGLRPSNSISATCSETLWVPPSKGGEAEG